jgi:hypothetical protein
LKENRRFWLLIGACAACSLAVLAVLPAERTIGAVIKLVYLHGALSRAGMVGFGLGGVAGLARLAWPAQGPILSRWSNGLIWSGWGFWTMHFLVSIPATRFTWGPWIAWGEPRVTMTIQVIAAGLAVILVSQLLGSPVFSAAANALLGAVVLFLVLQTGVLLHPLDPIGNSPSPEFRLLYAALVAAVMASLGLVAWRLSQTQMAGGEVAAGTSLRPSGGAR